jgi:2-polyprenyl-3-methyl-5-hydroxy-6-metoxy-1,4-benzoquinol methylase
MTSPELQSVEAFYDNFIGKSLHDYIYGNLRIEVAVNLVLKHLPSISCNALEIGCGMGVATEMIARKRPDLRIVATDISIKRIEYAKLLCQRSNIEYLCADVESLVKTEKIRKGGGGGVFYVVYLIDVFEHLPPDQRHNIQCAIGELLSENGKVILTYPTPLFQNYLRNNKPNEIQIIDEDIELKHISDFAEDIQGIVTYHQYVSIWRRYDYVHTIIEKNPIIRPLHNKTITICLKIISRLRNFWRIVIRKYRVKRLVK